MTELISVKAIFASSLLFIPTVVLVKISIIFFLRCLAPIAKLQRTGDVLTAVFLIWGIGAFLAVAFQCDVPNVWQLTSSTCLNIVGPLTLTLK